MSKSILYLMALCVLCLGCKVKEKPSAVAVAAAPKAVEKVPVNALAATRIEVDSHGQALDTDGDGVPDYKDHEKLTSGRCFPVDENGVGYCPEPDCNGLMGCRIDNWRYRPNCQMGTFEIGFDKGSSVLSDSALKVLKVILLQLYVSRDCKLAIGGCGRRKGKGSALCYERIKQIMDFFDEKKIDFHRILFGYGFADLEDVVMIEGTLFEPYEIPAPATKNKGDLK